MKRFMLLAWCCFVIWGLAGCGGPRSGCSRFCPFPAGRWKADKYDWEIVLEPNETVSSVFTIEKVRLTPRNVTTFPTIGGGKGIYEAGDMTVKYDPNTCELDITVELAHYYQDVGPPNYMEGSRTDFFTGSVSANGKELVMDWYIYPREKMYIASRNELWELPVDYNDVSPTALIFRKVDTGK